MSKSLINPNFNLGAVPSKYYPLMADLKGKPLLKFLKEHNIIQLYQLRTTTYGDNLFIRFNKVIPIDNTVQFLLHTFDSIFSKLYHQTFTHQFGDLCSLNFFEITISVSYHGTRTAICQYGLLYYLLAVCNTLKDSLHPEESQSALLDVMQISPPGQLDYIMANLFYDQHAFFEIYLN